MVWCFLVCGLGSTGGSGEERVEAEAGVVGAPVVVRGGPVGDLEILDELCRLGRFGGSGVGVGVCTALLRLDLVKGLLLVDYVMGCLDETCLLCFIGVCDEAKCAQRVAENDDSFLFFCDECVDVCGCWNVGGFGSDNGTCALPFGLCEYAVYHAM